MDMIYFLRLFFLLSIIVTFSGCCESRQPEKAESVSTLNGENRLVWRSNSLIAEKLDIPTTSIIEIETYHARRIKFVMSPPASAVFISWLNRQPGNVVALRDYKKHWPDKPWSGGPIPSASLRIVGHCSFLLGGTTVIGNRLDVIITWSDPFFHELYKILESSKKRIAIEMEVNQLSLALGLKSN